MSQEPIEEPIEDDNEFLNNFIASMDDSIKAVIAECERMGIPNDKVPFYLLTTMSHMVRLVKMLHGLKAQSHYIDLLKTSFERECKDIDKILLALDLPNARTEGGNLKVAAILNHVNDIRIASGRGAA